MTAPSLRATSGIWSSVMEVVASDPVRSHNGGGAVGAAQ